jgi:hypothetical protein
MYCLQLPTWPNVIRKIHPPTPSTNKVIQYIFCKSNYIRLLVHNINITLLYVRRYSLSARRWRIWFHVGLLRPWTPMAEERKSKKAKSEPDPPTRRTSKVTNNLSEATLCVVRIFIHNYLYKIYNYLCSTLEYQFYCLLSSATLKAASNKKLIRFKHYTYNITYPDDYVGQHGARRLCAYNSDE